MNTASLESDASVPFLTWPADKTCRFHGGGIGTTLPTFLHLSRHQAFHLKLSFTQDNGKKSSDGIDAYISTDANRIPLLVVGKLPIGEVKCYYAK